MLYLKNRQVSVWYVADSHTMIFLEEPMSSREQLVQDYSSYTLRALEQRMALARDPRVQCYDDMVAPHSKEQYVHGSLLVVGGDTSNVHANWKFTVGRIARAHQFTGYMLLSTWWGFPSECSSAEYCRAWTLTRVADARAVLCWNPNSEAELVLAQCLEITPSASAKRTIAVGMDDDYVPSEFLRAACGMLDIPLRHDLLECVAHALAPYKK